MKNVNAVFIDLAILNQDETMLLSSLTQSCQFSENWMRETACPQDTNMVGLEVDFFQFQCC